MDSAGDAHPAVMPRVGGRTLDPAVLAEIIDLQEDCEPDILAQTIQNYLASADQRLTALKRAWQAEDLNALARSAHAITGSVGIFGAWTLVELSRRVERTASDSDSAQLSSLMSELLAEYQTTQIDLQELLRQRETIPAQSGDSL